MLMRLTKGTKKALSLALSTALVLTSVNLGTSNADAKKLDKKEGVKITVTSKSLDEKDKTATEDGNVEITTTFSKAATAGTLEGANFEVKATTDVTYDVASEAAFSLKLVAAEYDGKDVLKRTVTGDFDDDDDDKYVVNATTKKFEDFTAKAGDKITFTYKLTGFDEYISAAEAASKAAIEAAEAASKAAAEVASKAAADAADAAEKAAAEIDAASKAAAEAASKAAAELDAASKKAAELQQKLDELTAPTPEPAPVEKGQMGNFNVKLNYVGDDSWGEQSWGDKSVNVTGDGDYKIEYTATSDSSDLFMMILSTDLYYGSLADDFALTVKNVVIGDKTYTVDNNGCWGFTDQKVSDAYRFNIVNPYNGLFDKTGVNWQDEAVTSMDKLGTAPVKAGDKITVNFNVSTKKASTTSVSIKAAKTKASVAPGKSTTVKYTVKGTTSVKATSSNKTVTVKVNKSKKTVTIAAKKTAVMGKTATVTLKAGSKKSTIKVTVSKTANVNKKKSANYIVSLAKVTKKVKASKIKVSVKNKKVAKVTVKKTASGQVTFQVKGLKKGKTTATLKYGKKSAKVSIVVK